MPHAGVGRTCAALLAAARAGARTVRAWGALALVQTVITTAGFERLRRLLLFHPAGTIIAPQGQSALVAETWHAVERARRLYPARVACLQRAAANVYLLRRAGVPADLVIGVRGAPFEAHAWIELDGRVVGSYADAGAAGAYTAITRV